MLKVESNLKLNGQHWGLAFTDGVAHTENVALAAKLLLKGYIVTDQPEQPGDVPIDHTKAESRPVAETLPEVLPQPAIAPAETTTSEPVEELKPKTTKPRKKVVTEDAADASGV